MDNKQAIEWLEYIKNGYSWTANCDKAIDKAITSLENERPKGYWYERIEHEDELIEFRWFECSNCHCDGDDAYNFCPCCGADMR